MTAIHDIKHVFIIGIKGVAMAGIARILIQMGKMVSGSDTNEEQITDNLISDLKVQISTLSDPIPDEVDLIIYSAAHGGIKSDQVMDAQSKRITVMSQGAFIAEFLKMYQTSIAVCGCHGKTGTSSLMAFVLKRLGAKVSWLVGAPYFKGVASPQLQVDNQIETFYGGNYEEGSNLLVFEADEYGVAPPQDKTPKILLYYPTHIVCTNIDFDHPDIYRDTSHVEHTFREFFTHSSHVYELNSHNLDDNKRGVVECLRDLGYEEESILKSILDFRGVARRMEYHGSSHGIDFYDDYAHHPAEIAVTIESLKRAHQGRRLIVLFQAHTYSRTQALKKEFIDALTQADMVLVDAIFPSAREIEGTLPISAIDLENLAVERGHTNLKGFENRTTLVEYAKSILVSGDVVLTLGAGDIYKIIPNIK